MKETVEIPRKEYEELRRTLAQQGHIVSQQRAAIDQLLEERATGFSERPGPLGESPLPTPYRDRLAEEIPQETSEEKVERYQERMRSAGSKMRRIGCLMTLLLTVPIFLVLIVLALLA